ncbi:extracellular solute-binding protein [Paenibacillus solisilvae]|uniref:Extracellular solute-binding protein n=1 Tax=Paenibacillus solisilvae TaxID=2486751 RepID=A0ABW0VQM6_9BACL
MHRKGKSASLFIIVALIIGMIASGCSKTTGSTGTASRVTLNMFMGNSGLEYPDGVDPSSNPFIDVVKNYANVNLKLEVPGYQDFKTKLDLLLASGKLPDLVHSWYPDEMESAADQGAFIDLKKYYDNSPIVQKVVTPQMMELAKSQSGHYYRIPMAWDKAPQGSGLIVRYDLVEKYNNGKWPETVDEWVNLMRKIHQAEPDSTVLSNRVVNDYGLTYGGTVIYNMFGAAPYSYRVQEGKVVSTFELPEYRQATILMKQLYDEGILDKEFATNDLNAWNEKRFNKNVLMEWDSADQLVPNAQKAWLGQENPGTKTWKLAFAPALKQYPTDPKYVWPNKSLPINTHGIYISSSSKNPDQAWKVIEGFASDQLKEDIFWGKEGDTYTVKDGVRIPNAEKLADPNRTWSLQLAILFGFVDGQDVKSALAKQVMGPEYSKFVNDSIQPIGDMATKKGYLLSGFFKASNEADKKTPESRQFITQATVEAIMGKITMEEFDQRVAQFKQKYGFIYDEMTKFMNDNKDDLRKKGVVEVDW